MYASHFTKDAELVVLIFLHAFCADEPASLPSTPATRRKRCRTTFNGLERDLHGTPRWTSNALLPITQGFVLLQRLSRHEREHICCTERSLYYRDPGLFGSQEGVRKAIRRVCAWLQAAAVTRQGHAAAPSHESAFTTSPGGSALRLPVVETSSLNLYSRESIGVIANGKSVLVGYLEFRLCAESREKVFSAMSHGLQGWAVTSDVVSRVVGFRGLYSPRTLGAPCRSLPLFGGAPSAHAMVVLEKECVLRTLLTVERALEPFRATLAPVHFIFLCTKGYPCVASRLFLRRLHTDWPSLPLVALTDGDPHGIAIALTVMGLMGTATGTRATACLPLHWLGVRPSEMPRESLRLLTRADNALLQRLQRLLRTAIASPTLLAEGVHHDLSRRLVYLQKEAVWMEKTQLKCEMEALPSQTSHLKYLCDKLYHNS